MPKNFCHFASVGIEVLWSRLLLLVSFGSTTEAVEFLEEMLQGIEADLKWSLNDVIIKSIIYSLQL